MSCHIQIKRVREQLCYFSAAPTSLHLVTMIFFMVNYINSNKSEFLKRKKWVENHKGIFSFII